MNFLNPKKTVTIKQKNICYDLEARPLIVALFWLIFFLVVEHGSLSCLTFSNPELTKDHVLQVVELDNISVENWRT